MLLIWSSLPLCNLVNTKITKSSGERIKVAGGWATSTNKIDVWQISIFKLNIYTKNMTFKNNWKECY